VREQKWFNADDFPRDWRSRARHPEAPRQSVPPLPVEALLRTSATMAPPLKPCRHPSLPHPN